MHSFPPDLPPTRRPVTSGPENLDHINLGKVIRVMFVFGASMTLTLSAIPAVAGSFKPAGGAHFETESVDGNFHCAAYKNNWEPGSFSEARGTFVPYVDGVAKIKKQIPKAKANKKKKLKNKMRLMNVRVKKGRAACKAAGVPLPTPTPKPTVNPNAPTPKPTQPPSSGACVSGDTCKSGCFGLPSSASKSTGHSLWQSKCQSCHAQPHYGKSFGTLKSLLPRSPMFLNESDSTIAHLTCYLNAN